MKTSQTHLLFCTVVFVFFLFLYCWSQLNEQWTPMAHFKQGINVMSTLLGTNLTLLKGEKNRPQWTEEAMQTGKSSKTSKNEKAHETGLKQRGVSLSKYDSKLSNGKKGDKEEKRQLGQTLPVRKNLLILSPGRGGSSFMGSLFDNNPHVMYCYEPLYSISTKIFKVNLLNTDWEPKKYKEIAIKVTDSFFRCDFSNISKAVFSAFQRSLFHRNHSKALSENNLPRFTNTHLSSACNSYNYTVIKVLSSRVPSKSITTLKKLFQKENPYDVKVVHLVRDPRAIVHSRIRLKWMKNHLDPGFNRYVYRICYTILQNLRLGLFYSPPWLKNRFKVVRYEDLALNTVNVMQELYRFAGLEWSANVDQWIDTLVRNTEQGGQYSLKRENASAAINSWKNAPEAMIRAVENNCGDLMNFLGYEIWKKKER